MSIDRNNYEEFFLLYVDGELDVAERAAVENFAAQNSDLARELVMLQKATLTNDDITGFEGKEMLLKSGNEINIANCESYFLLHVDDELTPEQKTDVERFVLQHPAQQNAFTLLQKTRLENEIIIFEGKEVLYKNEGRKVVPFYFRLAAAAVFIGVAALLYLAIPTANIKTGDVENIAVNPAIKDEVSAVKPTQPKAKTLPTNIATANNTEVKIKEKNRPLPRNKVNKPEVIAVNKPGTNNDFISPEKGIEQGGAKTVSQRPQAVNNGDEVAALKGDNLTTNNSIKQVATINPNAEIIRQVSFKELDTSQDEEDNSILFGSAQINKNKLRGLLKKASGLFEKKGNKKDGEKTIRIASFEIKGK